MLSLPSPILQLYSSPDFKVFILDWKGIYKESIKVIFGVEISNVDTCCWGLIQHPQESFSQALGDEFSNSPLQGSKIFKRPYSPKCGALLKLGLLSCSQRILKTLYHSTQNISLPNYIQEYKCFLLFPPWYSVMAYRLGIHITLTARTILSNFVPLPVCSMLVLY